MPKENLKRKTKDEIKDWVADKKTKKGDQLVIVDEDTASGAVPHIKVEMEKL